jgi:hypothetical protein
MGIGIDGRDWIPDRVRDFYLLHKVQTDSETHPASYQMEPWVKWLVNEAEHSTPSNVEVKNGGAIPPPSDTSSRHDASLTKYKVNFTFTFYLK